MDIFEAIEVNDMARVKELLNSGIDINSQNEYGDTPLYEASITNHIEIVELLLSYPNIVINAQSDRGATALFVSSSNNHIGIVELLLAHPEIDINIANKEGLTPLHVSSRFNNIEVVKLLLSRPEINVNTIATEKVYKETPLHSATERVNIEVVEMLLDHPDIDPNIKNKDQDTPFFLACKFGNIDILKLFLKYDNIDVNIPNSVPETPLTYLISTNSVYQIDVLWNDTNFASRVDINAQDDVGRTALHYACKSFDGETIIPILLSHPNIDPNIKDIKGSSPISYAYGKGFTILEILLKSPKIDVNVKIGNNDYTLIYKALQDFNENMAILLLSHPSVDVNIKNVVDDTYLDFCIWRPRVNFLRKLLTHKDLIYTYPSSIKDVETKLLVKQRFPRNIKLDNILNQVEE